MICYLYNEPSYLIFSADVPELLYYSHIPTAIIALLVGLFVYLNARDSLLGKLLLTICLSFSIWIASSLFAWTSIDGDFLSFIWPFFGVMPAFISLFSIYFIYVFLEKKDLPFKLKLLFIALLSPILLFAHTNLNFSGFNLTNCDAFDFEAIYFKSYQVFLSILSLVWILYALIKKYKISDASFRKQIILMGIGLEFFLITFLSLEFIATFLVKIGLFNDSRLEMYGLFGMAVFMVFIGILMTKFRTFNVGLVASQGLVVALVILVGSQFTFIDSRIGTILTSITLVITSIAGILLMRSVHKEIAQRQKIETLAKELAQANVRLKQVDKLKSEFVSIASHQLRSPLTSISGYASLIREGTYGNLTEKMKEPLERIEHSARRMAESIEDYLNVSRIESGNMKYHLSDFNLKEETEHLCDDLRPVCLKQGLVLLFRSRLESQGIVNADIGKVSQILHNLINNSIKYTPKGTISVALTDDLKAKKIFVDIVDTGVGMSEETLQTIFQKFERGEKANEVNVKGTGLGLFVAQKMAQAMGGDITAHSEGEGKGSRFSFVLPLAM